MSETGELVLYVGLGQSLIALVPRLRPLGAPTAELDPDRAFVFVPGGDPFFGRTALDRLPPAALADLHPHREGARSGPLTAASAEILKVLGPKDLLLTVNLARKGASILVFGPEAPTESFANLQRCIERAAEIARDRGLGFSRMVISWVQGQADARAPRGVYSGLLQKLVGETEALFARVTGRAGQVLWCMSQNVITKASDRRCVAMDQLDMARALAGQMVMACPEYMLERSDGLHLTPMSAAYLGALHGRAIRQVLAGGAWEPLHMAGASVVEDRVTVRFAGGRGRLVAAAHDPAQGPVRIGARAVENLGFSVQLRRGPAVKIVEATITGDCEVQLQMDCILQSGTQLTLGLPPDVGLPEGFVAGDPGSARGACSNLRTEGDGTDVLGQKLWDWAIHQTVPITPAAAG